MIPILLGVEAGGAPPERLEELVEAGDDGLLVGIPARAHAAAARPGLPLDEAFLAIGGPRLAVPLAPGVFLFLDFAAAGPQTLGAFFDLLVEPPGFPEGLIGQDIGL